MAAQEAPVQERRRRRRRRELGDAAPTERAVARTHEREAPRDGERTSLWAGLAVGMSIACFVGIAGVVLYLLIRNRNGQVQFVAMPGAPANVPTPVAVPQLFPQATPQGQLHGVTGLLQAPMPRLQGSTPEQPVDGASYATTMNSYTLSSTRAARIFTGVGKQQWKVQVRTINPPGAFAIFSTDAALLNSTGVSIAPGVLIVPAGGFNEFPLKPGEVLFAKGNIDGVIVSVAAGVPGGP